MKQLELNLNKRLLIVEVPEHADMDCPFEILSNKGIKYLVFSQCKGNIISRYKLPDGNWKLICKGSELTEDIAYEIVDGFDLGYFVDYNHPNPRAYKLTALESFISAIESKGYHWGENPVKEPVKNIGLWGFPYTRFKYHCNMIDYEEAQSKTFNPSKCIIFEIL